MNQLSVIDCYQLGKFAEAAIVYGQTFQGHRLVFGAFLLGLQILLS